MHSRLHGKEVFLQGMYDNITCSFFLINIYINELLWPYGHPFSSELLDTVRSPAGSYPFSEYLNLDDIPWTIQCIRCPGIDTDYHLHSLGFPCYNLPGLLRGVLSSLAEEGGGSPLVRGGAASPTTTAPPPTLPLLHSPDPPLSPAARQQTVVGGGCNRAAPCPSVLPSLPQSICKRSPSGYLVHHWKHQSQRLFPFSRGFYLNLELAMETCRLSWLRPQTIPSSESFSFQNTSDKSQEMLSAVAFPQEDCGHQELRSLIRHEGRCPRWLKISLLTQSILFKIIFLGSSSCGWAETNLTSIHDDVGSIPSLAQGVKDP